MIGIRLVPPVEGEPPEVIGTHRSRNRELIKSIFHRGSENDESRHMRNAKVLTNLGVLFLITVDACYQIVEHEVALATTWVQSLCYSTNLRVDAPTNGTVFFLHVN